jgi:prophage regulatory protein
MSSNPYNLNNFTKLLRLPQVLERYPVSRSTWWAGVRAGTFPSPVRLGIRCTAWRSEDIDRLIEEASDA